MAAIVVGATENVGCVYRKALELGGADEGTAGRRGNGYCAGYVRNIDGSQVSAFGIPKKQATRPARPWAAGKSISRELNSRAMPIRAERARPEAPGALASDRPSA